MGNCLGRRVRRLRAEDGEVASWLILAAGLALAAALAATTMGSVIGSLATRVADAAEGGGAEIAIERESPVSSASGNPTPVDAQEGPGAGGTGDDVVSSGSGNPTPVDAQEGPGAGGTGDDVVRSGSGNPTPVDAQEGPGAGADDDGPTVFPDWCYQSGGNRQCDEEGNCLSFEPLRCSTSAAARDAYDWHSWYEGCAVAQPSILRCRDFVPGFDLAFRTLLESEIGAHPGDLFLAAARACDAGHASCQLWTELAHFVFDNREIIATSTVLSDLIPGARGVSCIPSFIDGAITAGEATECAVGLVTGLSVPIPSGVIDDALEDG